jgi:DNA-binding NarL/FixJ family response regulator
MMDQDRRRTAALRARRRRPPGARGVDPAPSTDARALVVGPSRVSSAGLSSLLREAGLGVVGEAPAIDRAAAMARRLRPDVILIDLDRAGPSALAAIRRIATSAPRAHVVVLFADDDLDLVGALEAGAYACILKDTPMDEMLAATRAAARGELVVSPPVVRTLVSQIRAQRPDTAELTPRELEVLELLARGWDNGRIAASLYMSRATVKRHISSILRKLKVENRIQAAVRAVNEGLVDQQERP